MKVAAFFMHKTKQQTKQQTKQKQYEPIGND
jgi:hypothetical protein